MSFAQRAHDEHNQIRRELQSSHMAIVYDLEALRAEIARLSEDVRKLIGILDNTQLNASPNYDTQGCHSASKNT